MRTEPQRVTALVEPKHIEILTGLMLVRPDTTFSELVNEALAAYCKGHEDAANLRDVTFDLKEHRES